MKRSTQRLQGTQRDLPLRYQRALRCSLWCAAVFLGLLVSTDGQPPTRSATNIAALMAYSSFYHLRPILIVGKVATEDDGTIRVSDSGGSITVVTKGNTLDGVDEVRGQFWDVGRIRPDEPRLAAYDLKSTFGLDADSPWPRPGDVTAIIATSVSPASAPLAPSIRAIVLYPSRYLEQRVTITGQYSGRNLHGDLPDAPARSRYDFVLRSADAAIWVSNIRPKSSDFEFALDSRLDTDRWLRVAGTVQQGRGLQWIEADAGTLTLTKATVETVTEERETTIRVPAAPPPEVLFSVPAEGESDVARTTRVRIQFSRDLNPATLKGRVRVSYLDLPPVQVGGPTTPKAEFTTRFNAADRVLELNFTQPLERFGEVKVELLDGILGRDQQPLKSWTLTFGVGGSEET